ncbi:MAG: 4Fe-4S binding protein [Clostridia bacterium]|nr:4Fe-4S binding protein [Clostridia bacterium]
MSKFIEKIKKYMPTKRKWIQLYSALLHNAHLKGFVKGYFYKGGAKNVCAPGLNCYSCPGASASCPLGSLQNSLAKSDKSMLFYVLGTLLLYGILFGRFICGFLCPFGFIQELLYKIKTPKLKKSKVTRMLSYLKYVILVFLVILVPLILAAPGFCKLICPAGTLGGGIALVANPANSTMLGDLGVFFTWKFVILVGCIVGSVFIFRFFCRFLCPLGAIYGIFNKFSVFGIRLEKSKCVECGLCHEKCKMDIRHVADHECISCGECVSTCPTGAISWKGSQIFLPKSEIEALNDDTAATLTAGEEYPGMNEAAAESASDNSKKDAPKTKSDRTKKRNDIIRIVIGAVMVLALAFILVYYNFIYVEPTGGITANVGADIGNDLYDDELTLLDGTKFSPGTVKERVSVIYMLGAESVADLYGEDDGNAPIDHLTELYILARDEVFGEKVTVTVVYYGSNTELVAMLADEFDGKMIFALDEGGAYRSLLGTDDGLMTLIADKEGLVTKRFDGAYSADQLMAIIDFASIPVGSDEGKRAQSDTIEIIDEGGFTGDVIDPAADNGKIRVVNFWGTWCTGCKEELPYFDRVATDYADSVTVIAIHSQSQFDVNDASGYIAQLYPDSNIIFGVDSWVDPSNTALGDYYFTWMGGDVKNNAYPHTVILDTNGIIIKVIPNAVTEAELRAYVDEALERVAS